MNLMSYFHHCCRSHTAAKLMRIAALTLLFFSSILVSSYPSAYATNRPSTHTSHHGSPTSTHSTHQPQPHKRPGPKDDGGLFITEYPIPTPDSYSQMITLGPDGNLWFAEEYANKISKITPSGTITEFPIPTSNSLPVEITAGPDGNLWFTEYYGNKIGQITHSGTITEFSIPTNNSGPEGIITGPDGNLWFTEYNANQIGVMDTNGKVLHEYPIPTQNSQPDAIAAGPDGNLWFAGHNANPIGKITPSGQITEYPIPNHNIPNAITAGPDGNLWFTERVGDNIGKITSNGTITEYPILTPNCGPGYIRTGPDGNLWFTEGYGNKISKITPGGTITEYPISTPNSRPTGIAVGPDRNLWFAETDANQIGTFMAPPLGGALAPWEKYGGWNLCIPCLLAALGAFFGEPVDPSTGNLFETMHDITIPGRGLPIDFSRTYNSLAASSQNATDGPFGYGWTYSYGASLSVDPQTQDVTVTQESGAQVVFTPIGGGKYTAPPRVTATLSFDGKNYTLTRNAREALTFDANGRLTDETDLNGYHTIIAYPNSTTQTITDPAGRTLTVTFTGNHITSISDPTGRTVQYQYNDGQSNLTDVIDVNGGHTHYVYQAGHLLQTVTNPRGKTTTNHYNSANQVDWQTDPLQRKTQFQYNPNSTLITDPKGNQTLEQYEYGLRTSEIRGYNSNTPTMTSWSYDPATLGATSIIDANGGITTKTYDPNGNVLTTTDQLGRTTTNTYDQLNDVLTSTDPMGVTTTWVYDSKGNLQSQSRPLVGMTAPQTQVTQYFYDDQSHPGDVTRMIDPDGKTWHYGYDAYGNVNLATDPLGNKTSYTYDVLSREILKIMPRGGTYHYGYDNFGDLTLVVDPLANKVHYKYDPDRNLIQETDADGNVTHYKYDDADQQVQIIRADKTILQTQYDADGNVQVQIDGAGQPTSYGYDALNHLSSVTDPLNRQTQYVVDGVGNLRSITDPQNQVTTYGYDAANELQSITYSDGKTPNVGNFKYDGDGERLQMTDGTGTSLWSWDSLHRLTSSQDGAGNIVRYGYDLKNQLTSITYPGQSQAVQRKYDAAGRLHTVTDWLGNTTTFNYDADNNLKTEVFPTGTQETDTFTYDSANQLMGIIDTQGQNTLATFTYKRDPNNQLKADVEIGNVQKNDAYGYSSLNQVKQVNSNSYGYDSADNITQLIDGSTLQYDVANELQTLTLHGNVTSYGYDPRGNRTSITQQSQQAINLTYDQANRLTAYGSVGTYAYNGDGLRVQKNGTAEIWDVSQGLPLMIQEGSTSYIYGPRGLPIEQISGFTALYYHHDQLGSTRLLTDQAGTVQGSYTFDPYGRVTVQNGSATTPFGFAGQYTDSESGFQYLRARYYDPGTAQLISRDPAAAITRSPYGYVAGNPLNGSDPGGTDSALPPDPVCGGMGPFEANSVCNQTNYFVCELADSGAIGQCRAYSVNPEAPKTIVFPLTNGSPNLQFTPQGTAIAQAQLPDLSCDYSQVTLTLPSSEAQAIRDAWAQYQEYQQKQAEQAKAITEVPDEISHLLELLTTLLEAG